jgi:hypothetical protein
MFEGLTKKLGQNKNKKTKYFPECQWLGTRGRGPSPSARDKALGEEFFQFFKRRRLMLPPNATFLFRVPFFPECCARGRRPSPSVMLF